METTSPGDHSELRGAARPVAIVFGNRVAPYHPLGGVEAVLRSLLERDFRVRVTEDTAELVTGLAEARLVVAYADTWETPLPDVQADALVGFVSRGGGLLVLHNGVCWAKHPKVKALIGASFTGHPDQEVMPYRLEASHAISTGQQGFEMREEPYRYDFVADASADVFLVYEQGGKPWPAGWTRTEGVGRMAALQPGHSPAAFENPGYASLVQRAALWCAQA